VRGHVWQFILAELQAQLQAVTES